MGWLFTPGQTRNDLIAHLTRREENDDRIWQTLRSCTRGNVLWTVSTITNKQTSEVTKFIGCILLKNGGRDGWGYKDMTESMGPYYYHCPLSYLDEVPVANQDWRDHVRKYHRQYNVGDRLKLCHCIIPYVDLLSQRPLIGTYQGRRYRIKRELIADVIPVPAAA